MFIEVSGWPPSRIHLFPDQRECAKRATQVNVKLTIVRERSLEPQYVAERRVLSQVGCQQLQQFRANLLIPSHQAASMSKRPYINVAEYELEDLFAELRIFERLADGELSEMMEDGDPVAAKRCSLGGESYHTRVRDRAGNLVGRIHYVRCAFGHTIGVWLSVLFFPDLTVRRQGHASRPPR